MQLGLWKGWSDEFLSSGRKFMLARGGSCREFKTIDRNSGAADSSRLKGKFLC